MRIAFVLSIVIGLSAAQSAHAVLVDFSTTGSIDLGSQSVFEETGETNYEFGFTYDTARAPSPVLIPDGTSYLNLVDGLDIYREDFFGYSASGITAFDISFGSKSWSESAIVERVFRISSSDTVSADLWFNEDLEAGLPTAMHLLVSDSDGEIQFGGIEATDPGTGHSFDLGLLLRAGGEIRVEDFGATGNAITSTGTFTPQLREADVPAPTTIILVVSGLAALGFSYRRR